MIKRSYKDITYTNISVDIKNKQMKLPKLGLMPIRGYRNLKEFPYDIKNAAISREGNKYYASVCICEEIYQETYALKHAHELKSK